MLCAWRTRVAIEASAMSYGVLCHVSLDKRRRRGLVIQAPLTDGRTDGPPEVTATGRCLPASAVCLSPGWRIWPPGDRVPFENNNWTSSPALRYIFLYFSAAARRVVSVYGEVYIYTAPVGRYCWNVLQRSPPAATALLSWMHDAAEPNGCRVVWRCGTPSCAQGLRWMGAGITHVSLELPYPTSSTAR